MVIYSIGITLFLQIRIPRDSRHLQILITLLILRYNLIFECTKSTKPIYVSKQNNYKKTQIIKLIFPQSWYAEFNWLHWDPTLEKLLCYHCLRYYKLNVRKHGHLQNNVNWIL